MLVLLEYHSIARDRDRTLSLPEGSYCLQPSVGLVVGIFENRALGRSMLRRLHRSASQALLPLLLLVCGDVLLGRSRSGLGIGSLELIRSDGKMR